MTSILLNVITWLYRIGIVISIDIYGGPEKNPNSKQRLFADLRLLWFAPATAFVLFPQVAYMFLRAADILEIAEAFYPVILELGGSVQLLVLAIYRKDINRLLNDLQKFVKIKESSNERSLIFMNTEAKVTFYSKIFARQVLATFLLYVTTPVLRKMLGFYSETTATVDPNIGLFKDLYFFNASKSPMRELCYITIVVATLSIDIVFICINLLFFGLCLYIVALYKELLRMFECIDKRSKTNDKLIQNRSLRECVEFHLAIISFTERINNIFSHIIFVHYTISLLGLCCNIFEIFFTKGSNVIRIVLTAFCLVTTLFIYGRFGHLILDEANNLQSTIYGVRWYDFGVNEQKMIKLMILRAQKPCGLSAYNYFDCDLPTVYNIMTNVYTLVTFLQSIY